MDPDGLLVPDRLLTANWAAIAEDRAHFYLYVANLPPYLNRVRSALQVNLNRDAARQFGEIYPLMAQKMESYLPEHGGAQPLGELALMDHETRIVPERASIGVVTWLGPDAEVRLYRLGIREAHKAILGKPSSSGGLESVARVELPTALLYSVLRELRRLTE